MLTQILAIFSMALWQTTMFMQDWDSIGTPLNYMAAYAYTRASNTMVRHCLCCPIFPMECQWSANGIAVQVSSVEYPSQTSHALENAFRPRTYNIFVDYFTIDSNFNDV